MPYTTAWSEETEQPGDLVVVPGRGIAYVDEMLCDRDSRGVLWRRVPFRPGMGRPLFGKVHALRQRRAMERLLCQVCGGPANRTDEGVLWLLRDFRDDWPGWPRGMGNIEPPVCLPCARLSMRACPALRRGVAAVRVREYPIAGVRGAFFRGRPLTAVDVRNVAFNNPNVRMVQAGHLVRKLGDCTLIDLDELGR